MQVKVFPTIPDDAHFGEEWDRLVQAMESPQVFYTQEWALAVSRAYPSPQPLLFAAYRENLLVGIAALAVDPSSREAVFLAGTTADYCDFVSAPADREELIRLVMQELHARGISTLRLPNLPSDSVSAAVLENVPRASGYRMFARPAYFCAQIALDSPEQRLQIAQSARRGLKKAKNVAARMGGTTVSHVRTCEEFMVEFPEYAAASVARFLAVGQTSNLLSEKRRFFMVELAKFLAARGWLTFSTLKLNTKTVAWHFGFQFAGAWFSYLPAFESEPQLHPGPGAYLLCEILQQASQDPQTRVVDLGLGDEGYKQPYAKAGRHTLCVVASRSRTRLFRERARYRLGKFVRRSPQLERLVRICMARIVDVRQEMSRQGIKRFALSRVRTIGKNMFQAAEFFFLEAARHKMTAEAEFKLVPLSMKLLAVTAIQCENDRETQEYVQRSAARLQLGENDPFALLDSEGAPAHICWVAPFDGFQVPGLKHTLAEPAPNSAMLFDFWTNDTQSSRSAQLTAMIALHVSQAGRRPWICTDREHLAQFESVGFVPRFSLIKKRTFFLTGNSTLEFRNDTPQMMGLHPAA